MKTQRELTPREFLRTSKFSPERANERYPHARRIMLGGLFVSHSGADTKRIDNDIISPVVFDRFSGDGYFMHSRISGGAEAYRELVQAALHWCDKFMIVISTNSLANEWVQAEAEWALEHSRPIIAIRIDESDWNDFLRRFDLPSNIETRRPLCTIDFTGNLESAQSKLAEILDHLLQEFPRTDLGTPPPNNAVCADP